MMAREAIYHFDEAYNYKNYVLVNDRVQDDEGFYKNGWGWGVREDGFVRDPIWLEGLRSNSYSEYEEAFSVFKQKVDELTEETVDTNIVLGYN
jgi:hypothetical protein